MPFLHYLLLFAFLLPALGRAQGPITGLGPYQIGITTAGSLTADFAEVEQSYVKGTIALPCSHIRIMGARQADVAGVAITNLSLFFYDNVLFKITCDYTPDLRKSFALRHGKGITQPKHQFTFCPTPGTPPMLIWGETWTNGDICALAIHANGYTGNCQFDDCSQVDISSQRMSALASDCELKITNSSLEKYDNFLKASLEGTSNR